MPRTYVVAFKSVAITVAQDLFELTGAANKLCELLEWYFAQSSDAGDAASEQLAWTVRRFTGAYTSGSLGSAPTPQPVDPGDAAATFTAEVNNTTRATGGTAVDLPCGALNVLGNGYQWLPPPDQRILFVASSAIVIGLETAPADAITGSGYAVVKECG